MDLLTVLLLIVAAVAVFWLMVRIRGKFGAADGTKAEARPGSPHDYRLEHREASPRSRGYTVVRK